MRRRLRAVIDCNRFLRELEATNATSFQALYRLCISSHLLWMSLAADALGFESLFSGQCQRKCPPDAIVVFKPEKKWQIDSLKYCSCRRCVEVCPVSCLIMRNTYWPCVTTRETGLYVVTVTAAQAHCYDGEGRQAGAARPGESEGSHTGAKPGL